MTTPRNGERGPVTEREVEALRERKRRLAALRTVVRLCRCTWPLDVMRNGDGHAPTCPAHRPRSSEGR